MNAILRVLTLPWRASSGSSRWITALVLLMALAVVTPAANLYRGPGWVTACAALCVFAIGVLWLLVIPNALWLARDARALRLPAIARIASASPLAYALLSVIVPALLLGVVGGHTLELLAVFVLAAAGCLAYMLLPATLGSLLLLAVILANNASDWWHVTFAPHALPAWTAPTALAVALLAIWRWLHLLRAPSLDAGMWGRPIAWQYRLIREQGYFNALASARNARRDNQWAWLQPQPDLRRVGPAHPVRTIRMALGRALMPQTQIHQLAWAVVAVAVVVLCMAPLLAGGDFRHTFLALIVSPPFIGGICGGLGGATLIGYVGQIQSRWSGARAEVSLLALLPGLGAPATARRHLLDACLFKPLMILAIGMLAIWGIGLLGHAFLPTSLIGLLFIANCMALCVAMVLGRLGGKPFRGAGMLIAGSALVLLLGASFGIAGLVKEHVSVWLTLTVVAAWLALFAWLAAFAWRGWRALRHRPHPFLAAG